MINMKGKFNSIYVISVSYSTKRMNQSLAERESEGEEC